MGARGSMMGWAGQRLRAAVHRRTAPSMPGPRGSIDRFNGRSVDGWAFAPAHPRRTLAIAVMLDGVQVGETLADRARPDLASAGLGGGRHGFSLRLDAPVAEGQAGRLELVDADSGAPIAGGRCDFEFGAAVELVIESFSVRGIHGRLEMDVQPIGGDEIAVARADGHVVARAPVFRDGEQWRFRVDLPPSLYDGRSHDFEVELADHYATCRPVTRVLDAVQTPASELFSGAGEPDYAGLSRLAAMRYDALRTRLRDVASRESGAALLARNAGVAHDILAAGHPGQSGFPAMSLPDPTERPTVSVIVPVHDGVALTRHCLASLVLTAGDTPFEVIVVDDLSTDDTPALLASVANLVTVRNATNLGFLHSSRAGADAARGDFLVFLNNDTEVTVGWLEELVDVFQRHPDAGAVGAKLIYPDGRLQDAGGLVWDNGVPWNVGHGGNAWAPEFNYLRDVDYLTGAALMVSREAWDHVGGFDIDYAPAYYEDTDLAFRLRDAGYRTLYCPHAAVVHYEGGSHGTDVQRGVKRYQAINAERFVNTWRLAFAGLGAEGVDLHLAKDRRRALRVLVIDHAYPCLGQDAGSYAAVQEMRLMIELGCKLTFLPLDLRHLGHHVKHLQRLGIECLHAPFCASPEAFIEARGTEFDAFYVTRYEVAERVLPALRANTSAPVLFNNADLHFLREMRAAIVRGETDFTGPGGPLETRDRELAVMRQVDAILSYNETEHEVIASHLMRRDRLFKCPWVLDIESVVAPLEARRGIAFLGGFGHPPNEDAVRFFALEVMPLVTAARPGATFHVWGSGLSKSTGVQLGEHTLVEGYATTLHDVFDRCRVFVAPLRSGAGIKGKVLDSIAHGVPAVLSPVACESTGLADGISTFVANSPQEWAMRVLALLDDDVLWQRMSAASRAVGAQRYGVERGIADMRHVFEQLRLLQGVQGAGTTAESPRVPGDGSGSSTEQRRAAA